MLAYTKTVNISDVEWYILNQIRSLISHGNGDLEIEVRRGLVSHVAPSPHADKDKLKEMQR